MRIIGFKNGNDVDQELFHIMNAYPMADSLYYPLLMAPVSKDDNEWDVDTKLKITNSFIDSYINIRTICHKTITQSSIRNNIYDLIKDLRGCDLKELYDKLLERYKGLVDMQMYDNMGFLSFFSSSYMHYFLAREKYRNNESITDFESLLRSRKRDSYVLTRVFDSGLLSESDRKGIDPYYDSLANFCLVRRYDFNALSLDDMKNRLEQLEPYLPLKVSQVDSSLDYLKSRNDQLQEFVKNEWLNVEEISNKRDMSSSVQA